MVKVLHDKPLSIAENTKFNGCRKGLSSMVYKYLNILIKSQKELIKLLVVLLKVKLC